MTKSSVGDWSTTANSNTTVDGLNIGEQCPAANINNAIRSVMAAVNGFATAPSTTGTNTYAVTLAPAPDGYATNGLYLINVATASTSTTPTINANTLGAKTVVQADGSTALLSGDLNGTHLFLYDGTNLRVLNPRKYIGGTLAIGQGGTGATSAAAALLNLSFATYARGYLGGLILSNDGVSPNTVIDISAGASVSDAQDAIMSTAAFTKNCNAAWAVGSGNGALDTGSSLSASTWYHVYQIIRSDTSVVDFLVSTSATSPTLPTNYTSKRRIGSFKTDGSSHILAFSQNGDEFLWVTLVLDINAQTASTVSRTLYTLSVPTGLKVTALIRAAASNTSTSNAAVIVTSPDESDQSAASGAADLITPTAAQGFTADRLHVRTDTSARIAVRSNTASTTLNFGTYGWVDARGRFS